MRYNSILLAASAALLVSAQDDGYATDSDYAIYAVCQPTNSSGYPDMSAPCNQVEAITSECILGPEEGLSAFFALYGPDANTTDPSSKHKRQSSNSSATVPDDLIPQSNAAQRQCACSSQFFDVLKGCLACEKAHGSNSEEAFYDAPFIASMSSAYCAASATPSVDLAGFLNNYVTSLPASISSAAQAASTSSFSDPLGSSTDVSLYYTAAVTGTDAYILSAQTGTASASNSASGQITPTVGASASGSATGTSKAGVKKTKAAAVVGVLGLAGLVALL